MGGAGTMEDNCMPRTSGIGASYRTFEALQDKPFHHYRSALLFAILLLGAVATTLAQGGLYGPDAPRDTSYLRIINARPAEAATVSVAGSEWQPLEFSRVSPYRQLPPGEYTVTVGGQEKTLTARAEGFTTLVLLEDRLLTIDDTPLRDISRGLLTLYNLTSNATLSLRTADGTDVISGLAPYSAASIAISEAQVGLSVFGDQGQIGTLEPQLYRRGEAHSVIVLPEGSDPQVIYARAGAER